MGKLEIKIKTLTPLWTGGVDTTMDRIHETGLLGSLRWWYEAIVRGLGGYACDPTEHKCSFDADKYRKSKALDERQRLREAGLCDACQVFGATGWRRRFRLEVRPLAGEIDFTEGMFPSGRVHYDRRRNYRVGGWLLRGGYFGNLELRFTGEERVLLCEILPTLLFIEQWGALGPKTSIGYGVIEIAEIKIGEQVYERKQGDLRIQLNELVSRKCQESRTGKWWWSRKSSPESIYQGVLPAITNMFFGKVRFGATDSDWWRNFSEIQWLQFGNIAEDEAHWTGEESQKPQGPYEISRILPVARMAHWIRRHHVFPLSPIIRTRLRYGGSDVASICKGNGESDWCKFVFGTVEGYGPICGYCGTRVREDRRVRNQWWCSSGRASLASDEIVFEGKRVQSKVRVSWAYRTNDNRWEFRLWGWLPEHTQSDNHQQQRGEFLHKLKQSIGFPSQLQAFTVCWFAKQKNEKPDDFLTALLGECRGQESYRDAESTGN